jgi:L-ascorbate metabolism protein UlaG (beta-lactamase superfamily)
MGPKDAARAADFLEVKDVLGVHYDTFPPIEIDKKQAVRDFADRQVNLHLLEIGASKEF